MVTLPATLQRHSVTTVLLSSRRAAFFTERIRLRKERVQYSTPRGLPLPDQNILYDQPENPDETLINDDFRPTSAEQRTFGAADFVALWIGLVVCLPTYYLAGSMVDMGMSWWQGILTVLVGNIITLVPMVLNAHPGTKYGVPFPVLARAAFGIQGAHIPALLRGMVACGWFGIQTWAGASAIHSMSMALSNGTTGAPLPFFGISMLELACFLLFWAVQVGVLLRGMKGIKALEEWAAPVLVGLSVALLAWGHQAACGWGPMLSAPSQFGPGGALEGQLGRVLASAITANVGFWATLSLNIPDFARFSPSHGAQLTGQAIGLPLSMAGFTFVGLAVTSATVVVFGAPISDPIVLVSKLEGLLPMITGLSGLIIATLSTNIAANVVAPANALVNLAPSRISFAKGSLMTAIAGAAIMPWKIIESTQGFIFSWLIGYSALLGPVLGVMMADYFLIRKTDLNVNALFTRGPASEYWYKGGVNPAAMIALAIGILPNIPGFLASIGVLQSVPAIFNTIFSVSWFVGVALAMVAYCLLMTRTSSRPTEPYDYII